jgi:hypothetical protein
VNVKKEVGVAASSQDFLDRKNNRGDYMKLLCKILVCLFPYFLYSCVDKSFEKMNVRVLSCQFARDECIMVRYVMSGSKAGGGVRISMLKPGDRLYNIKFLREYDLPMTGGSPTSQPVAYFSIPVAIFKDYATKTNYFLPVTSDENADDLKNYLPKVIKGGIRLYEVDGSPQDD